MHLIFLFLLPLVFGQDYYFHQDQDNQIISSVVFSPVDSPCTYDTCFECLSNSCHWCPSVTPHCLNPKRPFSCQFDLKTSIGLISDVSFCQVLSGPNTCSDANTCTGCLQAGCKWCDGDGSAAYPPLCVGVNDPINCASGELHSPLTSQPPKTWNACDCGSVNDCTNCLATYGCAWCEGDGTGEHPGRCINPAQPFGCSIGAYRAPGGTC